MTLKGRPQMAVCGGAQYLIRKLIKGTIADMFINYKCYLKLKYYSVLDCIMNFLVMWWRKSLESRINFSNFNRELSQKLDLAHDSQDIRRVWR